MDADAASVIQRARLGTGRWELWLATLLATTFVYLTVWLPAAGTALQRPATAAQLALPLAVGWSWRRAKNSIDLQLERNRRLAERDRQDQLAELDAADGVVMICGVTIAGVDVLAAAGFHESWTETYDVSFGEAEPRTLAREWSHCLSPHYVPLLQQRAARMHARFEDGPKVDVVGVSRASGRSGRRRAYQFTWSPTTYFPYLAMAHSLDVDFSDFPWWTSDSATLRECLEPTGRPRTWKDIPTLSTPVSLGVTAVVHTSDGFLLGMVRADTAQSGDSSEDPLKGKHRLVLGGWQTRAIDRGAVGVPVSTPSFPDTRLPLHFMGEGVEGSDITSGSTRLDPKNAAARGVLEELGPCGSNGERLTATDLDIVPTAIFFDQLRYEVVFTYLCSVPVTIDQLRQSRGRALHRDETRNFVALTGATRRPLRRADATRAAPRRRP